MMMERPVEVENRRAVSPSHQLTLGCIPLVDCAPLVVAAEMGFAAGEGVSLDLVRETSGADRCADCRGH